MIVDGTTYHDSTPAEVIRVLEDARRTRLRLRLHYGVTETDKPDLGRDWMDRYDVTGYVGRSIGPIKIPLLVHNSRSYGGGGILDHCIVKIETSAGKHVLYQHPAYHIRPE